MLGPKKSGWNKEVAGSRGYLVNPAALKRDQISWNREKNGMVTNSLCMCLPAFSNLHVYGIYYSTITLMSIIKKSLELIKTGH